MFNNKKIKQLENKINLIENRQLEINKKINFLELCLEAVTDHLTINLIEKFTRQPYTTELKKEIHAIQSTNGKGKNTQKSSGRSKKTKSNNRSVSK